MSITELYFYAFAMFILFLTPGPVWVVLLARIFSNGWSGGLPLACGVIIADFTWSFLAVISISSISEAVPSITKTLTWVAAGFFLYNNLSQLIQQLCLTIEKLPKRKIHYS